jgi:hypothetical protein
MCTNSPFLNKAILGDGERDMCCRSINCIFVNSCKTVIKWSGFFHLLNSFCSWACITAAQPQTEFTTTSVVPSLIAFLRLQHYVNLENLLQLILLCIGFTISSGYISFILIIINFVLQSYKVYIKNSVQL